MPERRKTKRNWIRRNLDDKPNTGWSPTYVSCQLGVCVLSTRLVSHSIPLYYLSLFLSLSLSLAICHWLNLSLFVLCTTHTAQRESFLVVALFLWLAGHGWQSGQHGFVPQPEFGHVVALDVSGEFFLSLCHELHCLFCLDHFLCRIHHCGRTPRPRMRPHRWR